MSTQAQVPVSEVSAPPLSTSVEAAKLADSASLTPAETTTAVPTEEELYAEIARLWAANKVNRYDLGEKLCQLKQQAKHGEWMMKVQQMGIPHRTITSLISYYREEDMRRNTPPITDADFDDLPDFADSADEQQEDKPAPEHKKAIYYRPMIALKWGTEETAWKNAIEIIVAQDGINNPTEAALFAVVEVAKQLERQQQEREIEAIGVGSPVATNPVEPPKAEPGVALVAVAPAPDPMLVFAPLPLPVSDLPCSPRRQLVFTAEDEEVLA